jgi:hypothetical protein
MKKSKQTFDRLENKKIDTFGCERCMFGERIR